MHQLFFSKTQTISSACSLKSEHSQRRLLPTLGLAWLLALTAIGGSGCGQDEQSADESSDLVKAPSGALIRKEHNACVITGCNNELCAESASGVVSACAFRPEHACYGSEFAVCERQASGDCGWTATDKLQACLKDPGALKGKDVDGCARAGCSSEVCVEADEVDDITTTCDIPKHYACYKNATCGRNHKGVCGWLETPDFLGCTGKATHQN